MLSCLSVKLGRFVAAKRLRPTRPIPKLRKGLAFVANAERVNGKAEGPFCVSKNATNKIWRLGDRAEARAHHEVDAQRIAATRQVLRCLRVSYSLGDSAANPIKIRP